MHYHVLEPDPNLPPNGDSSRYRPIEPEDLPLFEQHFPGKIITVEEEYVDHEKTMRAKGVDPAQFDVMMMSSDYWLYQHITDADTANPKQEPLKVLYEELVPIVLPSYYLYVNEVGYQRKGMDGVYGHLLTRSNEGLNLVFEQEKALALLPFVAKFNQESFKKNMVDNFIDGQSFIWFWT